MPSRPNSKIIPLPGVVGSPAPNVINPGVRQGPLPMLDSQSFQAPARGLAEIGKGLQQAGPAVTELIGRKEEADMVNAEFAYKKGLMQTKASIAEATAAEPNHEKWNGIAEQQWGAFEQNVANLPNVPAKAREMIGREMSLAKIQTLGGLRIQSAEASLKSAGHNMSDAADLAKMSGDRTEMEKIYRGAESMGLLKKEGADLAIAQGNKEIDKVEAYRELNNFLGLARQNPRAAMTYADSPEFKGNEVQRSKMRNIAQQEIRESVSATTQAGQDALAQPMKLPSGEVNPDYVTSPEQIDEWKKDDPNVTPELRQQMKAALGRRDAAARKQYVAANAPQIASRLYTEVQEFEATNPGDPATIEDYTDLRMRLGELPDDAGRLMFQQLDAKMKNQPVPVDKTLQGYAHGFTQRQLTQGIFGQYEEPVFMRDTRKKLKDGSANPQYGFILHVNGEPQPVMGPDGNPKRETNAEMKEVAIARKSQVDRQVTDALRMHPEWAKDPNGEQKIQEVVTKALVGPSMAAVFDLFGGPRVPTVVDPDRFQKRQRMEPPKAEVLTEEPIGGTAPATPVSLQQDSTGDPGDGLPSVDSPSLFPTGGDATVGGDNMLMSAADRGEEIPEERKKKRR